MPERTYRRRKSASRLAEKRKNQACCRVPGTKLSLNQVFSARSCSVIYSWILRSKARSRMSTAIMCFCSLSPPCGPSHGAHRLSSIPPRPNLPIGRMARRHVREIGALQELTGSCFSSGSGREEINGFQSSTYSISPPPPLGRVTPWQLKRRPSLSF